MTAASIDSKRSKRLRDRLVAFARELDDREPHAPVFTANPAANQLLTDITRYPHAYVLVCSSIALLGEEKAGALPFELRQRLGHFEMPELARLSLAAWRAVVVQPKLMFRPADLLAHSVLDTIQRIHKRYGGDASKMWANRPSSAALIRRLLEFAMPAEIAVLAAHTLARDLKVDVADRASFDISVDAHVCRVMERLGLVEPSSRAEVCVFTAREIHPTYPGVLDAPLYEIGSRYCHARQPECASCPLVRHCAHALSIRAKPGLAPLPFASVAD